MTFGETLFNELAALRARDGSISREKWIKTADLLFATETKTRKRKPKGAARERNQLWDTLAIACGMNLSQITRIAAKATGVALADIKDVCPDVTADEIQRRANAYKGKYRGAALTPMALASHWAEFGGGQMTNAARNDMYVEPIADWRSIASDRFGNERFDWKSIAWLDVPATIRPEILDLIP